MKTKNIFFSIISIFTLFSLSSGFIDDLSSIMEEKYNEYINGSEDVNNKSTTIDVLNTAFNSKVNYNGNSIIQDFTNIEYNEDFEKAERTTITKNTKDLPFLSSYTPSVGDINALVIPVEFPDKKASNVKVKASSLNYQSVSSYFYNSSYGKLNMTFDIMDWQMMSNNSSYYERQTSSYYGDELGSSIIVNEALAKIDSQVDLSKYDNNNDGYIDALYIIYSLPYDSDSNLWWAFQYTVYENKVFDGVKSGNFIFASYYFLHNDSQFLDTTTYIHESGHMLGLEDYYDYDNNQGYNKGGLGGADMMDCNMGDHNAFSKMSLGWIDNPIVVNLEKGEETIITIDSLSTNGDFIILTNEYNKTNGMFQDYFIVQLIDADNPLNKNQTPFTKDGIRVYRIHAELDGYGYEKYYKYDNSYTKYNLIDAISNRSKSVYAAYEYESICAKSSDLFFANDSLTSATYYDSTLKRLDYKFDVVSIKDDKATLRIYR